MFRVSVGVQTLSVRHPPGLRCCVAFDPYLGEAGRARRSRGLPRGSSVRVKDRELLPTPRFSLFLLPGVHEREPTDMLRLLEPDEPKFRRRHPGSGRRIEVRWTPLMVEASGSFSRGCKTRWRHACTHARTHACMHARGVSVLQHVNKRT